MPEGFITFPWLDRDALLMKDKYVYVLMIFDAKRAQLEYVGAASVPLSGYARSRVSPVAVPLTPFGISLIGWNYIVADCEAHFPGRPADNDIIYL